MIVGIHGRKGAGKSWLAQKLVNHLGFVEFSFADPVRVMADTFLQQAGVPEKLITLAKADKEMPFLLPGGKMTSMRYLLQTLGTDWGRNLVDPAIWLNIGLQQATNHDRVVFDAIRFPNEARAIKNRGGLMIGIRSHTDDQHASENQEVECDFWIKPKDFDLGKVLSAVGRVTLGEPHNFKAAS